MTRIVFLVTNFGPYHLARLEKFHEYCNYLGWSVYGIELARSEAEYAWITNLDNSSFSIISIIEEKQLEEGKFSYLICKLYTILSEVNPEVLVISGYSRLAMLLALIWSRCYRVPAILLSATKEDDTSRSWWRETFKRWILKGYKAALVGGKPQKRYLIKLGIAPERVFLGYNVVGNESLHPDKIKFLPTPLPKPYFLAISRFVPKKNLLFFISSYAAYRKAAGSNAWDLVLCGDGQLRPQIEKCIRELSIEGAVHLPGFLQQNELLPYFAHAGCFIHASIQEQWGLVVNEAMAAGLPVLVSNCCGCFEDLVIEGVNGFGFDPENSQQLTELMLKMSSEEINLQKMGQAALEHIEKFSPDYFAQGLVKAVKYALARC